MKKEEFEKFIEDQFNTIKTLSRSKGEEYSRSQDQLANFKRQSIDLGVDPEKILMVYLNKHLDAIKYWVKNNESLSETIQSRIDDSILYLILLKAIIKDVGSPSSYSIDHWKGTERHE